MINTLKQLAISKKGATAVEYGLILAMIVIAMLGALSAFASETIGMWDNVSERVSDGE